VVFATIFNKFEKTGFVESERAPVTNSNDENADAKRNRGLSFDGMIPSATRKRRGPGYDRNDHVKAMSDLYACSDHL